MTTTLYNWQQAATELRRIGEWLKPHMLAGHQYEIEVRLPKRSDEQNKLLHAMLTNIARTTEWAGKKRRVDTWKRLLVAAWLRAEGESVEMLPAVDGHGFDIIFERTSKMTKAQLSSLVEYVSAWCAERGIEVGPGD